MYLERPEAARLLLERSLEIEPTYFALSNLGAIHFNAFRYAAAAESFEAALELDDSSYVVWGNLGYAYQFGVEPEKATRAFERALVLTAEQYACRRDNHQHAILIAGYHAMLGEQELGLEILQTVIDAEPVNPLHFSLIAEASEDLGVRDRASGMGRSSIRGWRAAQPFRRSAHSAQTRRRRALQDARGRSLRRAVVEARHEPRGG